MILNTNKKTLYRILLMYNFMISNGTNGMTDICNGASQEIGTMGENIPIVSTASDASDIENTLEKSIYVTKKIFEYSKRTSIPLNYAFLKWIETTGTVLASCFFVINFNLYAVLLIMIANILGHLVSYNLSIPGWFMNTNENKISYGFLSIYSLICALPPVIILNFLTKLEEDNLNLKEYSSSLKEEIKKTIIAPQNIPLYISYVVLGFVCNFLSTKIIMHHPQKKYFENTASISHVEFLKILQDRKETLSNHYSCLSFRCVEIGGATWFLVRSSVDGKKYLITASADSGDYYFENGTFTFEDPVLGLTASQKLFNFYFLKQVVLGIIVLVVVLHSLPFLHMVYKYIGGSTFVVRNILQETTGKEKFSILFTADEQRGDISFHQLKSAQFTIEQLYPKIYLSCNKKDDGITKLIDEVINIFNGVMGELSKITKEMPDQQKAQHLASALSLLNSMPSTYMVGPPGIGKTYFTRQIEAIKKDFYIWAIRVLVDPQILKKSDLPQIITIVCCENIMDYKQLTSTIEEAIAIIKNPKNINNESGMFEVPSFWEWIKRTLQGNSGSKNIYAAVEFDDIKMEQNPEKDFLTKAIETVLPNMRRHSDGSAEFCRRFQRPTPVNTEVTVTINGRQFTTNTLIHNKDNTTLYVTSNTSTTVDESAVRDRVNAFALGQVKCPGVLYNITKINPHKATGDMYVPEAMIKAIATNKKLVQAIKATIEKLAQSVKEINEEDLAQCLPFEDIVVSEKTLFNYLKEATKNINGTIDVSAIKELFSQYDTHPKKDNDDFIIRFFLCLALYGLTTYRISSVTRKLNAYASTNRSGLEMLIELFDLLNNTPSLRSVDIESVKVAQKNFINGFVEETFSTIVCLAMRKILLEKYSAVDLPNTSELN